MKRIQLKLSNAVFAAIAAAAEDACMNVDDWCQTMLIESLPQRCRVCGCTEDDCSGCVERTGDACSWVESDLCSACAPRLARAAR